MIEMNNIKLAVAGCIGILAASPGVAQGDGGFGMTLLQNVGPRYPGDEEKDVGGCIWRHRWVVDERGCRVLRRVRICY